MTSTPPLAEPVSLSALLDQAMRLLRRHLRTLIGPFAIPLAIAGAAVPLAQLATAQAGEPAAGRASSAAFWVWIGVTLAAVLVFGFSYVAMMVAATDAVAGRGVSGARAWSAVAAPRLIGTMVLVFLAWTGGLVLCIVPGIYIGLLLTATIPVIANEGRFGVAAMKRSATLMRYNPGHRLGDDPRLRSFLLGVTGGVIGYALSFIVQLPLIGFVMIMSFRRVASGSESDPAAFMRQVLWLQVPTNALGNVLQGLVSLYVAFGIALIYFDVVRRKEGEDLLAASERLAAGPDPVRP